MSGPSLKCLHCGEPFPQTRKTRKYCSTSCLVLAYRARNPERQRAAVRRYYWRNRNAILEKRKKYASENKPLISARFARWSRANRTRRLAYNRKWRAEHREYLRERAKFRYQTNSAIRNSAITGAKRYAQENRQKVRDKQRRLEATYRNTLAKNYLLKLLSSKLGMPRSELPPELIEATAAYLHINRLLTKRAGNKRGSQANS